MVLAVSWCVQVMLLTGSCRRTCLETFDSSNRKSRDNFRMDALLGQEAGLGAPQVREG